MTGTEDHDDKPGVRCLTDRRSLHWLTPHLANVEGGKMTCRVYLVATKSDVASVNRPCRPESDTYVRAGLS